MKSSEEGIREAWREAGIVSYFYINDRFGRYDYDTVAEGTPGSMLRFSGLSYQELKLRGLPAPTQPFALVIHGKNVNESLLEITHFDKLEVLEIRADHLSPESLKHLAALKGLRSVVLDWGWDHRGDLGYETINDLSSLHPVETISIHNSFMSDVGVRYLAEMNSLRAVDLSRTSISDTSLNELAKLPELEALNLRHCKITADGLAYLKNLPKLKYLNISQYPRDRGESPLNDVKWTPIIGPRA